MLESKVADILTKVGILAIMLAPYAHGQSLALGSGTAASGGLASLSLTLTSPAGQEPAALQWSFTYPAGSLTNLSVAAGPAATAAGKSVTCATNAGSYMCILAGMNANIIANGVVATLSATVASTVTTVAVGVSGTVGTTVAGAAETVTGAGSNISLVSSSTLPLGSISCPTSVNAGASATCTVALSAAAPAAGAVVSLASGSASLTVPASVTVAAGGTTAKFTATAAAAAADQSVNVTAYYGGVSKSASISVVSAPATISSLQCAVSSLAANAATTCSVMISKAAPSSGTVVTLSDDSTALTLPMSATIAAGATAATFAVSAAAVSTNVYVTVTASLGASSMSTTLAVTSNTSPAATVSFLLHANQSEITGVSKGAAVYPTTAPAGIAGAVVVTGTGAVNLVSGSGVSFTSCCANSNNAYLKFMGSAIGNIFNTTRGQISFNLKSQYSFTQRQAAGSYRTVFDVRDANSHQFYFSTQVSGSSLMFTYMVAGVASYYVVPARTEDALFGSGVNLAVTLEWANSTLTLSLNGKPVTSQPYTPVALSWTSASTFDIGAYEYLNFGGYDSCDDTIGEFTVTGGSGSTQITSSGGTTSGSGSGTTSGGTTSTGTTSGSSTALLQIAGAQTEVSGTANGAVVTPTVAPAGLTGQVVNNGGSVNFAQAGGVYFLGCCSNSPVAYYRFQGTAVGSAFNVAGGQITFNLTSRYSFLQRKTAGGYRTTFDVRDNDINTHLFYFVTHASTGALVFSYRVGGDTAYYYVPTGTEDTLFGNGVSLKVTITWDGSTSKLFLNDTLVKTSASAKVTPNWTAASNFDLGAYEYQLNGGFNTSDDVIRNFVVSQ